MGFGRREKRAAGELAERLRVANEPRSKHVRAIIVLYEEFCDMHEDIQGSYGEDHVTFQAFHVDYIPRLLFRTEEWATSESHEDLASRVLGARDGYVTAIEASGW